MRQEVANGFNLCKTHHVSRDYARYEIDRWTVVAKIDREEMLRSLVMGKANTKR